MKNADIPAMPIFDAKGFSSVVGERDIPAIGLTKRELMAAQIISGLVSCELAHKEQSWDELADSAVQMADLLLRRLASKQ